MSVASQIQRIKNAVADAYDSVEEKGGTLPASETVANLATAIDSITTGGGSVDGYVDIAALAAADDKTVNGVTYDNVCYILYRCATYPTIPVYGGTSNYGATKTGDGAVYTANGTHTWTATTPYCWIAIYFNGTAMNTGVLFSEPYTNGYHKAAVWIHCTCGLYIDIYSGFQYCYSLARITATQMAWSNASNMQRTFFANYSLQSLPSTLDFSAAVNVQNVFNQCTSLKTLPAEIDWGNVTSASNQPTTCFNGMYALTNLPTTFTSNWSLAFTDSTNIAKSAVATFDANGVVNGGFVYGLRSKANGEYVSACPNADQTIAFSTETDSLFTAEEQAAISTALTNKNWGITWKGVAA